MVDSLAISTTLDLYLSLHALATFSGMSVRWLRDRLEDPRHPLPHYKLGGKIVVRRSDFDTWALAYRRAGRADVEQIVNEVLRDLK